MKKLKLQFGDVKEMLTKDQMKLIRGGDPVKCAGLDSSGNPDNVHSITIDNASNCTQAQSAADSIAWYSDYAGDYPYGVDCNC